MSYGHHFAETAGVDVLISVAPTTLASAPVSASVSAPTSASTVEFGYKSTPGQSRHSAVDFGIKCTKTSPRRMVY